MGIRGIMLGEGVDWTPLSRRYLLGAYVVFGRNILISPIPTYNKPSKANLYPLLFLQLLNHMDGTGPPPMAKENIADIPTVINEQRKFLLLQYP